MTFKILFVLTLLFSVALPVAAQSPDPVLPMSGIWEAVLADEQNSCPDVIPSSDPWAPVDGSEHLLIFNSLETVPYDLHKLIMADDISLPEYDHTVLWGEYNQYEIFPNMMTQPFTYRYAVLDEMNVVLEYIRTLALSDCQAILTYNLIWVEPLYDMPADYGMDADMYGPDQSAWSLQGDGDDAFYVFDDPAAPYGAFCGTDQSMGETWFFAADQDFIDRLNAGYGLTLSYDIRIVSGTIENTYTDSDIQIVVGNGILLSYTFDYMPTDEWTRFEVRLDETAGWVDDGGLVSSNDPETFRQMVSDITQLNIRGEYIEGGDSACIANVRLGDDVVNFTLTDVVDQELPQTDGIVVTDTLTSGSYTVIVNSVSDACGGLLAAGTTQQLNVEFSTMGQGAFLVMLADGMPAPVSFVSTGTPGVYQSVDESMGLLTVYGPGLFTLEHTYGECQTLSEATLN